MIHSLSTDRTWPTPTSAWAMKMNWHDLLFMHYRIDAHQLRRLLPPSLSIDTYDGSAWIGIVPFRMTGVAPRMLPPVPWLSSFPELNVRTYVTHNGKPGVWFFSLDATNPLAVRVARHQFHLNYLDANIDFRGKDRSCDGTWVGYRATRTHRGQSPAQLDCEYRPVGRPFRAVQGSLEYFLTSRYCLYCQDKFGTVYRGEIDHPPWQLQHAQAIINENTMLNGLNLMLHGNSPVLHYALKVSARAWTIRPLG